MKLSNFSLLTMLFTIMFVPIVQAEDVISLPTIQVMADSELREETERVPFQEDKKVRQALQHQIYKIERDLQNNTLNEKTGIGFNIQPQMPTPDLLQISPVLQQYILSVATGLQSTDPSNGLFNMLEPLNINRHNLDGLRDGSLKINIEDALRLQQKIRDGLRER